MPRALVRQDSEQFGCYELVLAVGVRGRAIRSLTLWGNAAWASRRIHPVVAAGTLIPLAEALATRYRITRGCQPDRAAVVEALRAPDQWLAEMARLGGGASARMRA